MHMDQSGIINTSEKAESVLDIPRAEVLVGSGILSSGITSSGVTALDAVQPREVAYVLTDAYFGRFEVFKTVGAGRKAWWEDSAKLNRLIEAFKAGHDLKDSLFYAGISDDGWYRFLEWHPEFRGVKEMCESYINFGAMDALNAGIRKDPKLAWSFLRSTHPKFKKQEKEKVDTPVVQQTVQVAVSQNVDTTRIATLIEAAADAIIANKRGGEGADAEGDR